MTEAPGPSELAQTLVSTLTDAGITVACAESLTAGLVSAGIADVPGASAVLRGGAVTYATDAKAAVLEVPEDLLAARGAVDPDVAVAMARGVAQLFGADIGVATTGVAGPSEQDGKPVGTVYVAVADLRGAGAGEPRIGDDGVGDADDRECRPAGTRCTVEGFLFTGDRASIRQQSVEAAWNLVTDAVTA